MREQKKESGWMGGEEGGDLRGEEGQETVTRMYCRKKNSLEKFWMIFILS